MYWREVSKCDRIAITFAAPHYSIAKPLSAELGPPGQKIVLFGEDGLALLGQSSSGTVGEADAQRRTHG